ncbi:LOW QUALITY PROTEIN: hypothetical protein ACHAW6_002522 [Cyclotella cf. meneghiniana]
MHNPESLGNSSIYLGAKLKKITFPDGMGIEVTTMHASVSEKCGKMTGEISGLEHLGAFKVAVKGRKLFCYWLSELEDTPELDPFLS